MCVCVCACVRVCVRACVCTREHVMCMLRPENYSFFLYITREKDLSSHSMNTRKELEELLDPLLLGCNNLQIVPH